MSLKKLIFGIVLCVSSFTILAQDKKEIGAADYTNQSVEMADAFRADGKIYVVVAVILVILVGLLVYTYLIDRKITRIEKQLEKQ